jgi:hypothetical protein
MAWQKYENGCGEVLKIVEPGEILFLPELDLQVQHSILIAFPDKYRTSNPPSIGAAIRTD